MTSCDSIEGAATEGNEQTVVEKDNKIDTEIQSSNGSGDGSERNLEPKKNDIWDGYEGYAKTLTEFELPERGLLEGDEAKEVFEQAGHGLFAVYENGYVIKKESKSVFVLSYIDGKRPYPYGTQSLALFKTFISTITGELGLFGENMGSRNKDLGELTNEERDMISKGSMSWRKLHGNSERVVKSLRQFETYFAEQGYDDLATWTTDTVDLYEEILTLDHTEWKKAYTNYLEGAERIERMDMVIELMSKKS
ncbi:hypothetical protein LCL89_08005 [Halobacillus yeomjeoni]|uniref:hypothetical protein n=1 Tax=Halobacillus yeomjeoni TaxID=311194 RepID=UPI001CD6157D|nr:hypothetical protein [Halobacillus yeomjeoni]MCA0984003.1 hypothetical protein [Halobacillus yeomjeoni]